MTTHTAPRHHVWIRYVATAFGLFVVLVGAASVMTNLAHSTLGSNAARDIFAPAIAVTNPGALAAYIGRKKYGDKKFNSLGSKARSRYANQ